MSADQLTFDLGTVTPGGLHSPWCDVPADLLTSVWEKLSAHIGENRRLVVKTNEKEAFEVREYGAGTWCIVATRDDLCGLMGSCMNGATLARLLKAFLRSPLTPQVAG